MKHVLLFILMVFAIGISIPSATAVNEEEESICYDSELLPLASESKSAVSVDMQKAVILPPLQKPLDVKRLYLRNYFKGLTENFGYNHKGSCSYIAAEMILSYYDSYLCDNIIPEQYDVVSTGNGYDMINRNNSPGTINDKISDDRDYINSLSKEDYYNELKQKFGDTSFQLKLFDIAIAKNLDGGDYFSLSCSKAGTVMINNLIDVGYKYFEDFMINYKSSDGGGDVKQFILDNIDAGRPVLVSGRGKNGGHSFVCYDYDSKEKIYAHMGWHSDTIYTHFDPFSANNEPNCYNEQLEALAIRFFSEEHTHSYNYMVGNKAYCYCDEEIETYHNHNYTYVGVNKTNHRASCNCGKSYLTLHYIVGSTSGRYAKCGACGMTLDLNDGPYIRIMSLNKTPNGSYISQSGIPVIMEGDVEAYLNGTLKFGSGIEDYSYIN